MDDDSRVFFCSWSGGKDCCMALYRMQQMGYKCRMLLNVAEETRTHSRSHGLSLPVLQTQAKAIGLPIRYGFASWENYEEEFTKHLSSLKSDGIHHGSFGDIDLLAHLTWVERVCKETGIIPHEPLWQRNRKELVEEFILAGFKAIIVMVNTTMMPQRFLGRQITAELVDELECAGIDACGENGEFHTFVYGGPIFHHDLIIEVKTILKHRDAAFLEICVNHPYSKEGN